MYGSESEKIITDLQIRGLYCGRCKEREGLSPAIPLPEVVVAVTHTLPPSHMHGLCFLAYCCYTRTCTCILLSPFCTVHDFRAEHLLSDNKLGRLIPGEDQPFLSQQLLIAYSSLYDVDPVRFFSSMSEPPPVLCGAYFFRYMRLIIIPLRTYLVLYQRSGTKSEEFVNSCFPLYFFFLTT